jgi:hypothetical protein
MKYLAEKGLAHSGKNNPVGTSDFVMIIGYNCMDSNTFERKHY